MTALAGATGLFSGPTLAVAGDTSLMNNVPGPSGLGTAGTRVFTPAPAKTGLTHGTLELRGGAGVVAGRGRRLA